MANFATTADLIEYVPDITEHGVGNFDGQLAKAQTDIEKMIKVRWFDQEYSSNTIYRLHTVGAEWDATKLDNTQWTKTAVYRALANYILPMLSNFRPEGDAFSEQISFYREKFNEELDLEFGFGIKYDSNDDGTYAEGETHEFVQDRLIR
tara:strand:- start:3062 stop:3511 length:450 start_codon:yes stop_codon:yes gene_type:complete